MGIKFTIDREKGYYVASFSGRITDDIILKEYKDFFANEDWSPEMNALVDFGDCDLSAVTSQGMHSFARQVADVARQNNWSPKVAVYAQE